MTQVISKVAVELEFQLSRPDLKPVFQGRLALRQGGYAIRSLPENLNPGADSSLEFEVPAEVTLDKPRLFLELVCMPTNDQCDYAEVQLVQNGRVELKLPEGGSVFATTSLEVQEAGVPETFIQIVAPLCSAMRLGYPLSKEYSPRVKLGFQGRASEQLIWMQAGEECLESEQCLVFSQAEQQIQINLYFQVEIEALGRQFDLPFGQIFIQSVQQLKSQAFVNLICSKVELSPLQAQVLDCLAALPRFIQSLPERRLLGNSLEAVTLIACYSVVSQGRLSQQQISALKDLQKELNGSKPLEPKLYQAAVPVFNLQLIFSHAGLELPPRTFEMQDALTTDGKQHRLYKKSLVSRLNSFAGQQLSASLVQHPRRQIYMFLSANEQVTPAGWKGSFAEGKIQLQITQFPEAAVTRTISQPGSWLLGLADQKTDRKFVTQFSCAQLHTFTPQDILHITLYSAEENQVVQRLSLPFRNFPKAAAQAEAEQRDLILNVKDATLSLCTEGLFQPKPANAKRQYAKQQRQAETPALLQEDQQMSIVSMNEGSPTRNAPARSSPLAEQKKPQKKDTIPLVFNDSANPSVISQNRSPQVKESQPPNNADMEFNPIVGISADMTVKFGRKRQWDDSQPPKNLTGTIRSVELDLTDKERAEIKCRHERIRIFDIQ